MSKLALATAVALAGLLTPSAAQEPATNSQLAKSGTVAVSQIKLANGLRASKLIGAPVFNEANERVGSVDDLILAPDDKAAVAIVQVGGFLGVGGKLVAVPYHQLQVDKDNKVVMAGATKDSLNGMPSFSYGG
jgi:sporulation protein YlmC with PRC-barrel domain